MSINCLTQSLRVRMSAITATADATTDPSMAHNPIDNLSAISAIHKIDDSEDFDLSSIGSQHQSSIDNLLDEEFSSDDQPTFIDQSEGNKNDIIRGIKAFDDMCAQSAQSALTDCGGDGKECLPSIESNNCDPSKHKAILWALTHKDKLVRKVDDKTDMYTIDNVHEVHLPGNPLDSKDIGLRMSTVDLLIKHCDEHRLFFTKPPPPGEKRKFSLPTHEVDGVIKYRPKPDKSKPYGSVDGSKRGARSTQTAGAKAGAKAGSKAETKADSHSFTIIGKNVSGKLVEVTLDQILLITRSDGTRADPSDYLV